MRVRFAAAITIAATACASFGQACQPQWSSEFMESGLNNIVRAATSFDPDGPGPQAAVLVVGGDFTGAGNMALPHVAMWTGSQWSAMGSGLDRAVLALRVLDPDGPGPEAEGLYAGRDGNGLPSVFRWAGAEWLPVGQVSGRCNALTAFDDDGAGPHATALYIGGSLSAGNVGRWNGSSWDVVGTGPSGEVYALAVFDEDGPGPARESLFAGGTFTQAGGLPAANLARWDGSQWSAVGTPNGVNSTVRSLTTWDADGGGPQPEALYVGGRFTLAGGLSAKGVARWGGSAWSIPGNLSSGQPNTLLTGDPDGAGPAGNQLIAVGTLGVGSPSFGTGAAWWDGTAWHAMGEHPNFPPLAACFHQEGAASPNLVYVGEFTHASQQSTVDLPRVARWGGAAWEPLGPTHNPGMNDEVNYLYWHDPDGPGPIAADLIAGGKFTTAGNIPCAHIARRTATAWAPLGAGFDGRVYSLTTHDADGPGAAPPALFAGGTFFESGTEPTPLIARWTGSSWSALGAGPDLQSVRAMASWDPDGPGAALPQLLVGGVRNQGIGALMRWDGAWNPFGGGLDGDVFTLITTEQLPEGNLVIGGSFDNAGKITANGVAVWRNNEWAALGSGLSPGSVNALAVFDQDGAGPVLPALFAGGSFTLSGGTQLRGFARWNGVQWSSVGAIGSQSPSLTTINALAVIPDGGPGASGSGLYLAGSFRLSSFQYPQMFHIGRWSGSEYAALGAGTSNDIYAVAGDAPPSQPAPHGALVGGRFSIAGDHSSARIARWQPCPPTCMPDCNSDGLLNLADFGCFQTRFALADPYADCNGDGLRNLADFGCFQTKFALGCP